MKRAALLLTISVLGFLLIVSGCLLAMQDRMIYFPRQYSSADMDAVDRDPGLTLLRYETSQGRQSVFLFRPRQAAEEGAPEFIWFVFGGNAMVALDWVEFLHAYPGPEHVFVLMDYPGYGRSAGSPSPGAILESALAAREAAADALGMSEEDLAGRTGGLGSSLGSAAALAFAVETRSRAVVMVSPFTSMMAMARRQVTPLFAPLLRHRFDNVARLREAEAWNRPPFVGVVHGEEDSIVPASMGRELAERFPDFVHYAGIDGADHNWTLEAGRQEIFDFMERASREARGVDDD